MSTISIGRTPLELRRKVRDIAALCLDADHITVLDLIRSQGYYQLHPSEVVKQTGWVMARARRVMDELAEALDLTRVRIKSPFGVFEGWQWGVWSASKSWPVVAWFDGSQWVDGVPGSTTDTTTDTATATPVEPVTVEATPTPEIPRTSTTDTDTVSVTDSAAITRLLAETLLSNADAARMILEHTMTNRDMDEATAVEFLVGLSRSGWALTRRAVDAYEAQPEPAASAGAPDVEEMSEAQFERIMGTSVLIREMVAEHPETEQGSWFLMALNDNGKRVTVSRFQADRWGSQVAAEARCAFTEQDAHDAVAALVAAGREVDPISVGALIRRRYAVAA